MCTNQVVALLVVSSYFSAFSFGAKFPSDFKRCNVGSDTFDECLITAMDGAIKILSTKALPKYGLAQIDPIIIPEMIIGAGSMAVNLEQKYKNVKTYGYKNAKVLKAHLDQTTKQLNFTANVPQFVLDMEYEVNGRILLIPVFGKGHAKFILDDCNVHHSLTFDTVEKHNKTFINMKNYRIDMETKNAQFNFENLFNGNKELSDSIHKVVNENWQVIYDDVIASYNQAYASLFLHYAKSFFNKVPLNEVFPTTS